MSLQKVPVFKPGNILTHEMLNVLKEQYINMEEMAYWGYSDGILKGCNIITSQGTLTVGKGIVIVKSKPYYIESEVVLKIQPTNSTQIVVVRATEEEYNQDFIIREVKIMIIPENSIIPQDIELCRFRLQMGAILRTDYRDIRDMDTEYDTVCLKYAKWSAYEGSSLSMVILKQFLRDASRYQITMEEDKRFLSRIASSDGKTLNATEINLYLSWKLQKEYKQRSTEEMFKDLLAVLRLLQGGRNGLESRRIEPRRMIID